MRPFSIGLKVLFKCTSIRTNVIVIHIRFHPESNCFLGLYIFQRNWHLNRSMECFFTKYFSWANLSSLTWWLRRTYHHKKEQVFNFFSETCDISSLGLLFCFDVVTYCSFYPSHYAVIRWLWRAWYFFLGELIPSVLLERHDEMSTTSHRWLSASSVLRHFLRINNVPSHNFVLFRPSIKYWFKCLVFLLSHILRMYNFSTYDIRW